MHFQTPSLKRTARVLEYCMVSKTVVWKWIIKLREKLKFPWRRLTESSTGVYSDIDRNELISMRVYPTKNARTSGSFLRSVLNHCEGRPEFIVDSAPLLKETLIELSLTHQHRSFGPRSLVESAFSSFKQTNQDVLQ